MILKEGQKLRYEGVNSLEILLNEPNDAAQALAIVSGDDKDSHGYFNHTVTEMETWARENGINTSDMHNSVRWALCTALVRLVDEATHEGLGRAFIRSIHYLNESKKEPEHYRAVINATLYE